MDWTCFWQTFVSPCQLCLMGSSRRSSVTLMKARLVWQVLEACIDILSLITRHLFYI